MTRNYNRSYILSFCELSDDLQKEVLSNFFDEISDAEDTMYVISKFKDNEKAIPLSAFIKTEIIQSGEFRSNNFSHGIFSDSYYSGYFITLSKCGSEAVIAYKYF